MTRPQCSPQPRRFIPALRALLVFLVALPAHAQGGGYPGGGGSASNWLITVSYSGGSGSTTSSSSGSGSAYGSSSAGGLSLPSNGGYNGDGIQNSPASLATGGLTASVPVNSQAYGTGPSTWNSDVEASNVQMTFTLTWQPGPSGAPAPAHVAVSFRRKIALYERDYGSQSGDVDMETGAEIDYSPLPSLQDPVGYPGVLHDLNVSGEGSQIGGDSAADQDFTNLMLPVSNGTAAISFSVSWSVKLSADVPIGSYEFEAISTPGVDLCVDGYDLARFGTAENGLSGGNLSHGYDPTFTRWLPLAFSPVVDSVPFRYQAGGLPAPWGNIHCMYSIALTQESNPDLDGLFLLYRPSLDAYGDYNSPGAPYSIIPNNDYITPALTITDCNGDRLVFDQSLNPFNNVHSTLVPYNGGYQLQNAGPPGRLKEAGFFTYTFSAPSGAPATSQLLSIGDVFGNQQTLSYGGSPYLTVTDSSSGRELLFYTGTGGYLSSVDAPAGGGGVNTHTTTTMDSGGHLTALNVYAGGSDTAIHTDTWEYGGPNGDSVISSTEGLSQAAFNYVGDSYNIDPFALQTPRLSSASYGSAYDGSSSDNGGSVQGTVNYTYGPVKSGYDDWSPASRTNTITDARGNLTSQLFTLTNDISDSIKSIQTTGPDYAGAPAKSNISTINYSPDIINPSLISGTDPLGHVWTETLNENQTISQATDPLDDAWNFGYSPSDSRLLTSITDPTNLTWNFHYGENGNALSDLTSILDPAGVTQATINYNSFGQPINSTIPAAVSAFGTAEEAQLAYNATTGDVTSSTNPAGDDATLDSYDPLGDLLQTSLYPDTGNPNTSTAPLRLNLTWDGGQELTGATLPNGVQVNNAWNNQAATEVQTKAPVESGGATLAQMDFSYDTRGRLYSASDLVGVCEQFRYDRNSAITKVLDGNSNATTLSRGANDELTAVTWPDGVHHTSLSYDAAGREVSATDERGNVCNLVADNANRLTTIEIPSDTAENIGFTYDNASRLLSATDSTGSTSFNYDPTLKHLTSVGTTLSALPAGSNSFTTSYTYYPDGRRKTMSLTVGADVYTWSYTWDGVGRLSSITSPFSEGASWSYDHAGRLTGQTTTTASGAQLQTQYVYGVSGQGGDSSTAPYYLRNMYELVNGTAFWSYTLTHSYLGQLTGQSGSGSAGETENESYGFDPRGRLTSDSEQYTVDAQHNHANSGTFGYDLANNLNGEAGGWSYNTDDQVTATNSGLGGLPAATGLSYDASGNLTGLSGYSLSYDVWGELSGFGSVTFTYDSAGRRVSKTAGGVRTYYLYDGDNLIAELNGLGQVQTIYTWGAAGLISDRIGLNGTPQSRFYEFDATGSTRALLDQNGTGLSRGAYTAWGSTYAYTPSTPFAWLGQLGNYTDQETGLVLMQARYYAPSLGRFVSADPTGFNGGINLYAYCGDDPINYFDPLGLWQTGSHAGDSWEVLKGEGSALNPVNAWNGLKGMWAYGWSHDYFDNAACIHIFKVIGHSMEFWNQPDLHSMGSSFMGDELMVAPLIKKVPFGGLTKAVPVLEEATAPAAAAEEVMSDADAAGEAARCGGPVYMRAVGDDEAAAIKSGVIPESKTSPFPEESATRVFPPGVVDRMMPFFDQKNAEVPGTYTKMVTFKLGREIPTAIDSSTFPTYYVNVDDLAGALRADPIIEALEAHK